ncbi:MAG: shikimate kinase [Bacteroidota bacterium]
MKLGIYSRASDFWKMSISTRKVFLVGLPGSGKTTLGMELAIHLQIPFIDLDQEIEKGSKQQIPVIFKEHGEGFFRQLEFETLRKVVPAHDKFVLATGGGTPCFFENMVYMNEMGTTVYLNTEVDQIKRRLQQDSVRPLMQTNTIEGLHKERKKWYEMAMHTIANREEGYRLFDKESGVFRSP